jgi:SAM-dependent methyltransferase
MHWEALTLRLFFDVEAVLFDVWDNRQLRGLKNHLGQLGPMLNDGFGLAPAELERAQSLIKTVMEVQSFEELYQLLGFKYVVEGFGSLSQFADSSFQLVVSAGVLEHVKREALPELVSETRRVLKQDGWAIHSIDTSDHLSHYDAKVSKKMYLSFSELVWKLLCANEVQYINRMQRGEWLELFKENGFELVDEERMQTDISKLRLASRFVRMERRDLESTVIRLAFRRR